MFCRGLCLSGCVNRFFECLNCLFLFLNSSRKIVLFKFDLPSSSIFRTLINKIWYVYATSSFHIAVTEAHESK